MNIKTAVILTGAPRTWNFCKDYIVQFINDMFGDNVDWFIFLHDSSTVTKDQLTDFFKGTSQNLVSVNLVKKNNLFKYQNNWDLDQWSNFYYKSLFQLRYLAGLSKRLHEFKTGKIYDRVFFARPDCVYLYNTESVILENNIANLKNYYFHVGGDFNDVSFHFANPSANDVCTTAGMISADLISNWNLDYNFGITDIKEMKFRNGTDIHSGLSIYCKNHLITVPERFIYGNTTIPFLAEVVRPTQLFYDKDKLMSVVSRFNKITQDMLVKLVPGSCEFFHHKEKSTEYRLKSCVELGIDPKDYFL